jgi:hypothetical protein
MILFHFLGMTAETEKTFFFGFGWKDIIYNGQSARANNKWDWTVALKLKNDSSSTKLSLIAL